MKKRAVVLSILVLAACTSAQPESTAVLTPTETVVPPTATVEPTSWPVFNATPDPDYDPFEEPFLSDDPSEYELGRNWYWHNCMTCHGDVGQGLTDEFRAIWAEDHQNCWAHGCHVGNSGDEGFPIPRLVPALVSSSKLAKFSSEQDLFTFLKATHPPQTPGVLSDEEYLAIAGYVFSMNGRH